MSDPASKPSSTPNGAPGGSRPSSRTPSDQAPGSLGRKYLQMMQDDLDEFNRTHQPDGRPKRAPTLPAKKLPPPRK